MPVSYRRFNECVSAGTILNEGTDEELQCQGYERSLIRNVLYYTSVIFTLGIVLFVFKWKPVWSVKFRKKKSSLANADEIVLKDKCGQRDVILVTKEKVSRSFPTDYAYSPLEAINSENGMQEAITDSSDLVTNEGFYFKYFIHHHVKYYWDSKTGRFKKLRGYDYNTLCSDFLENFSGLTPEQQQTKLLLYGENSIDVEVKSYFKLFKEEVLNPFYVFQIFSIILWFMDNYVYFAACILLITSVSMLVSLYETRRQSQSLHDMVSTSASSTVFVCRYDKTVEEISSTDLVPGDVIVIPTQGCTMLCDAVLITGSCIVNESMLTGESVPITKTQIPHQDEDEVYSPDHHKRHTLFCGTQVIQTRYYGENQVTAVVVRTGFSTAKGELVRSILFPRPMGFKFYRDSMRFILMLFFIALLGIAYSIHVYIRTDYPVKKIIIRLLDIVTIVVPPALPAAMTIGSIYAQNRLKKQKIFCISPPRINVCGKIKIVCFDKTGTLTEEGLDLSGVVPIENQKFIEMVDEPRSLDKKSPLITAMATCHSLTRIEGELRGDPLDLKMFQATGWTIEEPGNDTTRYDLLCPMIVHPPYMWLVTSQDYMGGREKAPFEVGIIRQFTFSSNLQRMSVIARVLDQPQMNLYTKGAPEKIVTLCLPETVPENFNSRLEAYTLRGYRVIALAWKMLDPKLTWLHAQKIKRNEVEQNLTFLGLIIMRNTLKPETTAVIKKLTDARIRTVMATGDNMHTAISVARECGMISSSVKIIILTAHAPDEANDAFIKIETADRGDVQGDTIIDVDDFNTNQYQFCMSGRSFVNIRRYFPQFLPKFVVKGTIFARMSPEQKSQLIKELQALGYIVGMCGDGANDCGALKAADVGISLSEAEASVAAPFTSRIPNIECVPIVIKEGRCALVTSFGVFKYMALYSMIQFISVLILYTLATNLGDQQFLYIDLCLATIMAIVMSYTKPYDHLVAERPAGSLVSLSVIFSILCQIFICAVIQVSAVLFLQHQFWYIPNKPNYNDEFFTCWEATVIFCVSNFQYVILAAVFATGPPFRKPFYSNFWMVIALIVFTTCNVLLVFSPFIWLSNFFQLNRTEIPEQTRFRSWLLTFPFINLCLSIIVELFATSATLTKISRFIKRKSQPKNRYRQLENEICESSSWLPIEGVLYSRAR